MYFRNKVFIVIIIHSFLGSFPWIAALGYEDGQGKLDFLCGAALITDQHILTAAHCVYERPDL